MKHSMSKNAVLAGMSMAFSLSSAQAANHDPQVIIPFLKDAKMTLLQGIDYAEKLSGISTSAKFEVDNGKLTLSVYTVPEGLSVEPEKATLTEISGVVSESPFTPKVEVFADKAHIARSSVHMTLFQLSPLSLKQVIARALARVDGAPIDARNPMVRNRRAVADVVIALSDGSAVTVSVDLENGQTSLVQ